MKIKIFLLALLLGSLFSKAHGVAIEQDTLSIHFATQPEARRLITANDEFTSNLNQFDYDLRLSKLHSTAEEWKQLVMREARSWTPAEQQRILKAFRTLRDNVQHMKLHLPYPDEVIMVKTTMREELGAGGYTRKNWIALGANELKYANDNQLATLLAHELFHVLSRHSAIFKKTVYATIGFNVLDEEIIFPDDVMQKRISNPDISHRNSYIALEIDGQTMNCAEMIYTASEKPAGNIFQSIQVGFIPLDAKFKPMIKHGKTILYPLSQVEEQFVKKVGVNTHYNIDPEEISADHFSFLLTQKQGLPNPEIIEDIKQRLQH